MLEQRKKLWYLWATFSLIIFVLLLWFTINRKVIYTNANYTNYIWVKWFGIIIVPNILIIVSTFVLEERVGLKDRDPASQFLFRMCYGFSFIFLLIPFIAFFNFHSDDGIDSFKSVAKICYSIEPVLTVTLGTFFYGDNIKEYLTNRGN